MSILIAFTMVIVLVTFEKITYATSDSIHSCLLVPSITRHTRPTYSILSARARAARESNAIGFKQLLMQMRRQFIKYICWVKHGPAYLLFALREPTNYATVSLPGCEALLQATP